MSRRTFSWSGHDEMQKRMDAFERIFVTHLIDFAWLWAVKIENWAKDNHPWENQTGNAEAGLHAFVVPAKYNGMTDEIRLTLSHGVEYGRDLELKHSGNYAVIMRALDANAEPLRKDLATAFGVK